MSLLIWKWKHSRRFASCAWRATLMFLQGHLECLWIRLNIQDVSKRHFRTMKTSWEREKETIVLRKYKCSWKWENPNVNHFLFKKQWSFGNQSAFDLGFDYFLSPKACRNSEIFIKWLKSFDGYIEITQDRSVELFVENASCRGLKVAFTSFKHVAYILLSANTTSFFQPLDAGIIYLLRERTVNNKYYRR